MNRRQFVRAATAGESNYEAGLISGCLQLLVSDASQEETHAWLAPDCRGR